MPTIVKETSTLYVYKYPEDATRPTHRQKAKGKRSLPETLVGGMLTATTEAELRGYENPAEAAGELSRYRIEKRNG